MNEPIPTVSISSSKWAKKRQIIYIISIIIVFILLASYPVFKIFYKAPTCFDGKQNQEEVGVDCGGQCNILCATQVRNIEINWSKAFPLSNDFYDVAASIENTNINASVKNAHYTFKLYDKNDNLITERSGETFINSFDKFIIFEPNVYVGDNIPSRTTIEFTEDIVWTKETRKKFAISVKNKKLINIKTSPRLNAILLNNSIQDIYDIEVTAVIYNKEHNAIAVSSSFLDVLEKNSSKNIFFTWPNSFTGTKKNNICTAPSDTMIVFDRSGSMGFGGNKPPQPLTSAKSAAKSFMDDMHNTDKVGLVSFATKATNPIDQKLTNLHDKVKKAIESILIFKPVLEQHTNIGDGIEKATQELASERHRQEAKSAIVILTDGVASRPLNPEDPYDKEYSENYARIKAQEAQNNGISIYTIGLGDSINEGFLRDDIASSPSYYYKAALPKELKDIYNEIAKSVCEDEVFITEIFVHIKDESNPI
jgi:Mg-chelatase subunit ChlD